MTIFYMKTIIFCYFISNVIICLFMVPMCLQYRNRFAGLLFWMLNFLLQAIGQLLLLLRGTVSDFVSIIIANTIMITGLILFYEGLERFVGKRGPQAHNYLVLILFTIIQAYFSIINPNLAVRNINLSIAMIIVSSQCMWLMLWRVDDRLKKITRGTGIVFFFYTLIPLVRILLDFVVKPGDDFFKATPVDSIAVLSYMMLGILLTYTLILMINELLYLDVRAYAEEKKKMAGKLNRLASTDSQTGISNRMKLDRTLTAEMYRSQRYNRPLSAILFDIDHFKSVNDTFGHAAGDALLKGIAALIKEQVRKIDIIGRWGGDEFLIICPETGLKGAQKLAEKLRKKIEKQRLTGLGKNTVSMGVAQFLKDSSDEDLLKRCDDALYKAKHKGRNRVEYSRLI